MYGCLGFFFFRREKKNHSICINFNEKRKMNHDNCQIKRQRVKLTKQNKSHHRMID